MTSQNYKENLIDSAFIAVGISVLLTGIFWCFFSRCQDVKDLFSVFGILITIIGFYIALVQIAKLRKEEEIIQATFILAKFADIREFLLESLHNLNSNQNISKIIVGRTIDTLVRVQMKIFYIKSEDLKCMDCDNFNVNLNIIIDDLRKDSNNMTALQMFRKGFYNNKINNLLHTIADAEKLIKSSD